MKRLGVTSTVSISDGVQRRHRFYRPIMNSGINLWKAKMGRTHRGYETWVYRHSKPDPRPAPESVLNDYFGRTRLWNPIVSKMALINKKAEDWGYPERDPPPTGLRRSREAFPFFFEKYFPETEVHLILDSVINNETDTPIFTVPSNMSKAEIANYLKNIYNVENIVHISTKNISGQRYKNEIGVIRITPQQKLAFVRLDSPVTIRLNQIKGSDDTPDKRVTA
jgi:large subunit ribosomal protein L23